MLVGIEDLKGSTQKITGIVREKHTKGPDKGKYWYRVWFKPLAEGMYTDELWLSEEQMFGLLTKALELDGSKFKKKVAKKTAKKTAKKAKKKGVNK